MIEKLNEQREKLDFAKTQYEKYCESLEKQVQNIQLQIYAGDTTGSPILDYTFLNYNFGRNFAQNLLNNQKLIEDLSRPNEPFIALFYGKPEPGWYAGIFRREPTIDVKMNEIVIPTYGIVTQYDKDVTTIEDTILRLGKNFITYSHGTKQVNNLEDYDIIVGEKDVTKLLSKNAMNLTLKDIKDLIFS